MEVTLSNGPCFSFDPGGSLAGVLRAARSQSVRHEKVPQMETDTNDPLSDLWGCSEEEMRTEHR